MKKTTMALAGGAALAFCMSAAWAAEDTSGWVTAWATATQDPLPAGFAIGNPAANSPEWGLMFPNQRANNQTFRMMVRPFLSGDRIRLRFSNLMGDRPVTLDSLSVAQRGSGREIVAASQKKVTFGGADGVTIAPGRDVLTDVLDFAVEPEKDVAVTFHLVGESGAITWHAKAMETSYLNAAGAGDATKDVSGAALDRQIRSWLWLNELQAWRNEPGRATIVAIGDSITDGSGTTIDGHDRWTDFLNRRLRAAGSKKVVVNSGIGGNRVTTLRWGPVIGGALVSAASQSDMSGAAGTPNARCDACGAPAIARLERDALNLPNVSAIILFEGVNDIGGGGGYGEIIAGMQDVALRAKARGVKVYAATITPYYGFAYDLVYPDVTRRQVNDWIRTTKVFDAVFDFDAVARDSKNPARIAPDLEAPDHIHLNPKGYEAAAKSIPLKVLDDTLPQ